MTKVAPCSACAGPNTAPLKEWAIMMWSRTSTAYTDALPASRAKSGIVDSLAENAAPRAEEHAAGAPADLRTESAGSSSTSSRSSASSSSAFSRRRRCVHVAAVRRRDLADLARDQLQPAAVERAAQRHRHVGAAVPAEARGRWLRRLPRPSAVARPAAVALAWTTRSHSRPVRMSGGGECQPEARGDSRARRIDVDQRHVGRRQLPQQKCR